MKEKQTTVTIEPTEQVLAFLRVLQSSGLYGRTIEEVAERLICHQIIRLINDRVIRDESEVPLYARRLLSR